MRSRWWQRSDRYVYNNPPLPLPTFSPSLISLMVSVDHGYLQDPVLGTGRFSEAGLHEWMPFVIFRARSHERSQHHFRADFCVGVAARCLWSSTNATIVAVGKITGERGWRVEKKVSLHRFFSCPEDCDFVEKMQMHGASYNMSNTLWLQASKNAFKVGRVKFTNSLSPPSIAKKVCSQGT